MTIALTVGQATFLQGPVSINMAATGSDGWPRVCRAQGCVVARDRKSVTVLVSLGRACAVLDALDTGSMLACVFSRPATHATLQLKGRHSRRVPVTPLHRDVAKRSVQAFAAELASLGYGDDLAHGVIATMDASDLIAVRFAPETLFDQTPGPDAGRVLATA